VQSRLWLATTDATSWAAVDWDGERGDRFAVWQHGTRRLWDEVEATYRWWRMAGEPGPERFGLTVGSEGLESVGPRRSARAPPATNSAIG
jgi:hypothetical protein